MEALRNLTRNLARLPGVGRRSAERMASALVRDRSGLTLDLANALRSVAERVRCCSLCGSATPVESDPCRLCCDTTRENRVLCVVEDPGDIALIEASGGYRGRYHALMGRLSPLRGEGPADLRMKALVRRIRKGSFEEVVLALSTDGAGQATAGFLAELLKDEKIKVTRLGLGLPSGSAIMYSDPATLGQALRGRQLA